MLQAINVIGNASSLVNKTIPLIWINVSVYEIKIKFEFFCHH